MEYKKVEKCTRREETGHSINSNLFNDKSNKYHILKTSNLDIHLQQECTITAAIGPNIKPNNIIKEPNFKHNNNNISSTSSSSEIIKDLNFEYEEEWDIDGIPELLNELDADIEKSLKNIHAFKFDNNKTIVFNKKAFSKPIHQKHYEKEKFKKITFRKNISNSSVSTFTGFSKGGHLISSFSSSYPTNVKYKSVKQFKQAKYSKRKDCTISMSSQIGNNSNSNNTISGTGVNNIISGQAITCSSNSNKPNNKMSIDHQATLDKGLKMKIKRTKPGTKSSEAKHEIVKASEQQQNGLIGSGHNICSPKQEDVTSGLSVSSQSTSSSCQNSNVALAISNLQASANTPVNKKLISSQNNTLAANNGSTTVNNASSLSNSISQTSVQGTKRGSSGHRRDKTKEKSHSNRIGTEKTTSVSTEKEPTDRPICHCVGIDGNVSTCSNTCIRKTDNNTLSQRLSTQNTNATANVNASTVPPGVFTPSNDGVSSTAVSNFLAVTTVTTTPVCSQTTSNSVNANAPGPPCKEVSANNGGNIKISSHIAAQLAAVAASNNSTGGAVVTASTFSNTDIKSSLSNGQNQMVKHIAPGQISTAVQHQITVPILNNNTSPTSSLVATENSINNTFLANEISESPPAKRLKHKDNSVSVSSNNKEMVDICIGTSVGTITEPDCLGPCEPGTSVTLEGIVWHETEGGVLVVNVTWRGKTYVGTLLDCTRHDWAPPRFCDSPTDDVDTRTVKGRTKRGRAAVTPDLSNFTETRSSIYFSHSHVHSKLRNGSTKGGRGTQRTSNVSSVDKTNSVLSLSSGNSGTTPSTSPTSFLPPRAEKRKSKDESPPPASGDNEVTNSGVINASGIPISSSVVGGLTNQPQSLINPVTGLNVQITSKKCKTSLPCAISPVLLECPEQDCSKKYKHVNGLRYHQSHAHGSITLADEDSLAETEEHITPQHSPLSATPTLSITPNPSNAVTSYQGLMSSHSAATQISEESHIKKSELILQLENSEKELISETAITLTREDLLTSTESSSTNITAENSHQKQFLEIVGKKNINSIVSMEQNNQISQNLTGKSAALGFGQGEHKTNRSGLLSPNLNETESVESKGTVNSVDKFTTDPQDSRETFCGDLLEKSNELHSSQQNSATNKASPTTLIVAKTKRGGKSPSSTDNDAVEVNSCNVLSRDGVQSPAYSDISDDSTPINEQILVDKKNADIVKKQQNVGLSSAAVCPSSQSNLGNYGMYQFYQQQQFIVPTIAEQQQNAKTAINANAGPPIIQNSLVQQENVSEFNSKKEPPLDLIPKANLNVLQSNQNCLEINKDSPRSVCVSGSQGNNELSNVPQISSSALGSTVPSKSVSHFYAYNYMPSTYPFNVDYGSASISSAEDNIKPNRLAAISSPNDQSQQQSVIYKDERSKDDVIATDNVKTSNPQISSKQSSKSDSSVKSECIKQETICTPLSQITQHMQIQSKDNQGIGVYANMYQRHPLTLSAHQLTREEELRRYYIFSDQQRRQNSSSQNNVNQQVQNASPQSCNQQCKEDGTPLQQQAKVKANTSQTINKPVNAVPASKESPKHKQEEELKGIKQEGQKPTMETQGPPPPPTSQYFLHPSYITSTPFGFDPNHPMYRNVLMPASSPYNTPPYHLPIPRYHSPEDLSRNTGTKALDALHHAASQYYTTHKIHELSERALKSPNSSSPNTVSSTIKIGGSNSNIGTTQHLNISSNIIGHHAVSNPSTNVAQLPHNLGSQNHVISNKQDITVQKTHGNTPTASITTLNEPSKPQTGVNSSTAPSCGSGSSSSNGSNNLCSGNASDSRSPPPQRHVHTHHHTHVGLGYPMYSAPYGAAVLASQQAAAVAVINPFPPGPNK